jgi:NADH dehydrogenase (ubiquinone) 1 beta subcomplex subunit 1
MGIAEELRMTFTFLNQRKHLMILIPIVAGVIGWKLDKMEIERLTLFRDKSALFGREVQKPSWP